jgi:hypothetical protein
MACNAQTQKKWTIEMKTDPRSGRPPVDEILVFCLSRESLDGGIVTGMVFNGADDTPLSSVMGFTEKILNLDPSFMILGFTWNSVRILLAGYTFLDGTTRVFRGKFGAFASLEFAHEVLQRMSQGTAAEAVLLSPGDGETGTATGTQT